MNSLTATGLTTATQPELLATYTTGLQKIYGSDINLDQDTPDGQNINITIQSILDVLNLITQVYNSFNPDFAIGTVLDQRCAINGILRKAGTYTLQNVTITNTQTLTLYGLDQTANAVYTVADTSGQQYQLLTTQTNLAPGSHVLAFQAVTIGAISSGVGTITVPVTVVLGVSTITNGTGPTVLGINEETDGTLRVRRQRSTALSSKGYLQGLRSALENINGITSAFVYENKGSGTDANTVPGHSIWAIVQGSAAPPLALSWNSNTTYSYGQIASSGNTNYISWQDNNTNNAVTDTTFWGVYNPVAQAIYAKRNAGCGMKGSSTYVVTQVDGTFFTVQWDTVTTENLYIFFNATSIDGVNAPNTTAITAQLPTLYANTIGVYGEVNVNQLATLVQQIDPNTLVTNAGFSKSPGGPFTNNILYPTYRNNIFTVSAVNIVVV